MTTLDQYFSRYGHPTAEQRQLRLGQSAFNLLYDMRPDLCARITGTNVDPFYDDSRLPVFFTWIDEHWGDEIE